MRLKFKRIITMIVQNIMLVGEVFQIEVSDGFIHPWESSKCKLVCSCGDYWGTSFQEFVCVLRVKKDQMNECAKWHLY